METAKTSPEEMQFDEEQGLSIPCVGSGDTKGASTAALSGVTLDPFIDSARRDSAATQNAARKINREDVKGIFQASHTKGTVTIEQVIRIKAMHDKISNGVNFNFNYYCLLMIASVVAGLGLALDSATTVISSMLLSPIM